jgi:hypothetical protein
LDNTQVNEICQRLFLNFFSQIFHFLGLPAARGVGRAAYVEEAVPAGKIFTIPERVDSM